jgi:hypothetical protein
VDLDDHPLADFIAHMASPDHQFIAGFCVHRRPPSIGLHKINIAAGILPGGRAEGPRHRGRPAFPVPGKVPGSRVQPGPLVGDVVKFCGSRTGKQVSYLGQDARHRELLADLGDVRLARG